MLAQAFQRKDAKPRRFFFASLPLCVFALIFLVNSCGTKTTDMRTLAPAETLVYLETNDLGAALHPIVDSKPFNEVAKRKPDLSALKGVQLAVAITGFETSEEKLTDEHSVGRVQPHFVAIADTHAWHFQAVGFAENKIGAFVAQMYDSEPTLEKPEKNGGRYLTWTAKDGRKAYAFVTGSIIYFTNDETAIDKCLVVSRGEADSVAKTGKVQSADRATLASGYISTDGVTQIANIAALKFASDASDESEVQSAIAGILPQLIRGTVTDAVWTQTKTDAGIEDKWQINMPTDVANVFSETLASGLPDPSLADYLPDDLTTVSRYNLKDPLVALRSVLLVAQDKVGPAAGQAIGASETLLFEPYGIRNPELFLSASRSNLFTAKCDRDGEQPIVLGRISNPPLAKDYLSPEMKIIRHGVDGGTGFFSDDDTLGSYLDGDFLVSGDKTCVDKVTINYYMGQPAKPNNVLRGEFDASNATIISISTDSTQAAGVADVLLSSSLENVNSLSTSKTETRFNRSGMERKTTSDFGFIGWIIAQLNDD
jgi:hypothetical protein